MYAVCTALMSDLLIHFDIATLHCKSTGASTMMLTSFRLTWSPLVWILGETVSETQIQSLFVCYAELITSSRTSRQSKARQEGCYMHNGCWSLLMYSWWHQVSASQLVTVIKCKCSISSLHFVKMYLHSSKYGAWLDGLSMFFSLVV